MSRRLNAFILVMVMAIAPLVPLTSAHSSIGLSTDANHIILSPGEVTNLTLTIHNNGSSIETYSVAVSGFNSAWEIIPSESNVSNVIPTYSAATTIVIRLSTSALPSDSGTLTITVTEPDANVSTDITVILSAQAIYLPAIDTSTNGDNGLVQMAPGDDLNLSITITNDGNVNDTILLSVNQTPDLVGFWTNWTSGGGSNNTNNSGNSTGGNNTGGNNTGGNNTGGNNTGGNNTGGNGTNGSLLMSGPQGWQVRFIDDVMDTMVPGEDRQAILQISIPSNENPGFFGFELFAASALGNFSVSSTMVVNVTAVHDLRFSYVPSGVILLPGENSTVNVNITSLSTADANWTWAISVVVDQNQTGGIVQANCQAVLPNYSTFITAGGIVSIDVNISTYANTHAGDSCNFALTGTLDSDTSITESVEFTLVVGQQWNLSMVLPTSIKLDVGESESFNVAISNDGSEEDTISLIGIDKEGITFTNPSPVTLARGVSQYVVMEVQIDSSLVGNITLDFTMSSTNSGTESVNASGIFEVKAYAELMMEGPADNRLVITPGQNSSISLSISNDGTRDLDLSASISGLPSGISVSGGLESISLDAGNSTDIELELVASTGVMPSSSYFTITYDGGWASTELTIELQITERNEIMVDSSEDRLVASAIAAPLRLMVTNLGTSTDTFVANVNNSQVSDWFTISVDKLSLNLAPGESGNITITAREIAVGAPITGGELFVTVTSTGDSSIMDSLTIDIIPQIADGLITIMSDDNKAAPGGIIYGNVIITNLGNAWDSMLVSTIEMDCDLSGAAIELAPSMSSPPIPWSCTINENEHAGMKALAFRLTSTARSDMVLTTSEAYTVEPIWSDEVISFTFEENDLIFDESIEQQTISLTICNEANTYVEGNLELIGKNEPQMDGIFYRSGETGMNSTYSLSSNGCQDFRLLLTPLNLDGFEVVLVIHSVSQVEGQTVRDESDDLRASVAGPHLPPDGLNLGLFELDNKNSLILLSTGWVLSLLLISYIRLFRKPAEEEEEEEEEIPLGTNEVRIDEYNKVTCCSCEARLGVPEDSEPPFRFTCPKCETRIRVVD
ncbi:MAG: hypothetical protein HOE76_04925 [Euryarchaeota archaeon]|nr:hypothetical protein [Euryarchaeota archaeon]MBT4981476.1 hypothetical protein [Euryarchaeota archaeon]